MYNFSTTNTNATLATSISTPHYHVTPRTLNAAINLIPIVRFFQVKSNQSAPDRLTSIYLLIIYAYYAYHRKWNSWCYRLPRGRKRKVP